MHTKWTAVLLTTALAGGLAATTGVAGTTASALPVPPAQTLVRPAVAVPDPTKTLDVLGLLGSVLKAVGALVGSLVPVPLPTAGAAAAPVDADALQDKLTLLDAASAKLKQALPAATVPALPTAPGTPGLPVPAPLGDESDQVGPTLPLGSVEDQLAALNKHAAELVAAATAKKPDADAVKTALTPLSTDSLGLSTATVTRLTGM